MGRYEQAITSLGDGGSMLSLVRQLLVNIAHNIGKINEGEFFQIQIRPLTFGNRPAPNGVREAARGIAHAVAPIGRRLMA